LNGNEQLCGILNVYKPQDWTSFDVIAKLRGLLKIKRLGHAGTLDPMATGVLPVFVGKATKACDIIPDNFKEYAAGFELGISTDTEDITGRVLERSDKAVERTQLEKAAQSFVGDIIQIPPMYSAVKVNGKKLYEYAREGKVIEREARPVHIDSIDIIEYDERTRRGRLAVNCRKGTYVRTIISDIGKLLGTGGAMTSLERTYSGGCGIADSLTLEQIAEYCGKGEIGEHITPLDKAFYEYGEIRLGQRLTELYKNGVKLYPNQLTDGKSPDDKLYRVYGADGAFLGIGRFEKELFRSVKNFY